MNNDTLKVELIDFDKDDAAQELLGYAGIAEPYENLISRVSLDILRKSVPECQIESIRYVRSVGRHSGFRVAGIPLEAGSSKIALQDMTMPFDLEIIVNSGESQVCLKGTFTIECRKMDEAPENDYLLEIHEQKPSKHESGLNGLQT